MCFVLLVNLISFYSSVGLINMVDDYGIIIIVEIWIRDLDSMRESYESMKVVKDVVSYVLFEKSV